MTREQFVTAQAEILDEFFALAPGEDDARHRFAQMAVETYDCCAFINQPIAPSYPYRSAHNFAYHDRGLGKALPAQLLQQWSDWKAEYERLRRQHPLVELRDMIHDISESDTSSSWPPAGLEVHLEEWASCGDRYAIPFEDRHAIATPAFYQRLLQLRDQVEGWLYWNEETRRVCFAPKNEWEKIKAERRRINEESGDYGFYGLERHLNNGYEEKKRTEYLQACRDVMLYNDARTCK